ncbi:hypothetical protein MUP37_02285, partial [Candidatus Bathyarchaeota archaeon]|nr:hypothetical protein [Candidatus Bathyarchaeota archaeon]
MAKKKTTPKERDDDSQPVGPKRRTRGKVSDEPTPTPSRRRTKAKPAPSPSNQEEGQQSTTVIARTITELPEFIHWLNQQCGEG